MGYEIKMSEVIDMRKVVLAAYAAYETEIAAIDAARVNLMDPGVMEGKTADAISMYLNEVHGAIEYTLEQALTELKDRVVVYENGFANVDGSNEAHITQDSLENVQQRVNGNMDEFVGYVTRLSGILESVSDIYPTYMPGTGEVSNKYDSSRAVAANLNEIAGSYEAEHVGDCANINGILDSVLSIINAQNNDAIGIKDYTSGKIANLESYQSLQQSYSASIEYYSEHMQDIVDAQNNIGEKIDAEAAAERAKKGFWDAVAAVGTMAIGAAAIICTGGAATPLVVAAGVSAMAYGASNLAEAGQEIYYGMNGDAKTKAFNPVRDTLFMGNQTAYDIWGSASTAMSLGFAFAGAGAQAAVAAGEANPLTISSMANSAKTGATTFFKSGLVNMAKTGVSVATKTAVVGGTGAIVEKVVTPYTSDDFGRLSGLLTAAYVGSKVFQPKDAVSEKNINKNISDANDPDVIYGTDDISQYDYNMVENPGPLAEMRGKPAKNFYGGRYNAEVLTEDRVLYRAGNSKEALGQWFSETPPESVIKTRIDMAVRPQWIDPKTGVMTGESVLDTTYAIKIPKGTTIYTGPVGGQGGIYCGGPDKFQIYIREPWNLDVKIVDIKPLK